MSHWIMAGLNFYNQTPVFAISKLMNNIKPFKPYIWCWITGFHLTNMIVTV